MHVVELLGLGAAGGRAFVGVALEVCGVPQTTVRESSESVCERAAAGQAGASSRRAMDAV